MITYKNRDVLICLLKRGTLIDASLIRSAVNTPAPPDIPLPPDADGRPASKLVKSPRDPDAALTKKESKYVFGYKMHVAMDQGSRIIRRLAFTPANINESVPANTLICGDEAIVYADKAYDSSSRRARLKTMGIRDGIMRRSNRWHHLKPWAVRRNAVISHRRAPVEPLFALLTAFATGPCFRYYDRFPQCRSIPPRRHRDQSSARAMAPGRPKQRTNFTHLPRMSHAASAIPAVT